MTFISLARFSKELERRAVPRHQLSLAFVRELISNQLIDDRSLIIFSNSLQNVRSISFGCTTVALLFCSFSKVHRVSLPLRAFKGKTTHNFVLFLCHICRVLCTKFSASNPWKFLGNGISESWHECHGVKTYTWHISLWSAISGTAQKLAYAAQK